MAYRTFTTQHPWVGSWYSSFVLWGMIVCLFNFPVTIESGKFSLIFKLLNKLQRSSDSQEAYFRIRFEIGARYNDIGHLEHFTTRDGQPPMLDILVQCGVTSTQQWYQLSANQHFLASLCTLYCNHSFQITLQLMKFIQLQSVSSGYVSDEC